MSCYNPIKAFRTTDGVVFKESNRHDIIGDIEIPCGMCIGCRMRRAEDWKIRCLHEAQMHKQNCFITLTYATNALPPNASLCKGDYQKFIKRLRKAFPNQTIRYYMCGEYGPLNGRPHYHANLFGFDFTDRTAAGKSKSGEIFYESKLLTKIWGHGKATVQNLTPETCGYTTGYIMKKQLGRNAKNAYDLIDLETGEIKKRIPEYNDMSRKPGIGYEWYQQNHTDITRHDIAVLHGREHQVPKYYDKLTKRAGIVDIDALQFKRELKAREIDPKEKTEARRKVREQVQQARIRNHERSNDL